jgi:hypothetical protein
MPTCPLLDISTTGQHTESSDTLCTVANQILFGGAELVIYLKQVLCPRKDRWVSRQEVGIGHVHVLVPFVLLAFCTMARFILHEHTHELVLEHQQLFDADRHARWRRGGGLPHEACPQQSPRPVNPSGMSSVVSSVALVRTICQE